MNTKHWLLAGGVAISVCVSGCTSTQRGAAVGGGIGATTGIVMGHAGGILDSAEGGWVGFAAGGLAGALVGDAIDEHQTEKREQEMQTQINALQGELASRDRDGDRSSDALAGKDKALADLQSEIERLRGELAQKPEIQNVQVEQTASGQIRFTILNEVLFDSGKAELKKDGLATLDSVLGMVNEQFPDRKVMVEGHTDTDPIKRSTWKSNWELSAARSLSVVHYCVEGSKMPADRLSAQAFGEFRPVAPNDTNTNKRQNRRAVIVVMPPEKDIVVVQHGK